MLDKELKQEEVDRLFLCLSETDPTHEEYEIILKNLTCLMKKDKDIFGFSKDEILKAVSGFVGIMAVLYFERFDTVTSRAFNMIKR